MADEQPTLRELIERAIFRADANAAFDLVRDLEARIATTPADDVRSLRQLEGVKARLMAVAMRYYSEKTLEDLFEEQITAMLLLPDDVDLIDLIKSRLRQESFVEDKNHLREALRNAIARSQDLLGVQKIKLGSEEVNQTVENWIKVFTSEIGVSQASSVQIARFFSQNPDVRNLSENERASLRRLINVYEYLKISSGDVQGYDTPQVVDDPQLGPVLIDDTGSERIYSDERIRQLQLQAARGELWPSELADLNATFPGKFEGYTGRMLNIGSRGITPQQTQQRAQDFFAEAAARYAKSGQKQVSNSIVSTAAGILGLKTKTVSLSAIKQTLSAKVADEKQFASFLRQPAVKDFILQYFPSNLSETDRSIVEQNPVSPVAMQAFLQIVLTQGFSLDPEETLWRANDILKNVAGTLKDFRTIVTYDVVSNRLVWRY